MTNPKELFADGVLGVGFDSGVVRIDLCSNSVTEKDDDGKPLPEFRQRIVMTTDGFVNCFMAMENLINQLVEAGVIDKEEKKKRDRGSDSSTKDSVFN